MIPGDLVTIRRVNVTHRYYITYVDVYDSVDHNAIQYEKKWEPDEIGILLEGRDENQEMVQVFHHGRIGWVDKDLLKKL